MHVMSKELSSLEMSIAWGLQALCCCCSLWSVTSHFVAQSGQEITVILLPQLPKCGVTGVSLHVRPGIQELPHFLTLEIPQAKSRVSRRGTQPLEIHFFIHAFVLSVHVSYVFSAREGFKSRCVPLQLEKSPQGGGRA